MGLSHLLKLKNLFPALLAFLAIACYLTALEGQFLYDDEFLIQRNQLLGNPQLWSSMLTNSSTFGSGGVDSFFRPLQLLTYGLVFQINGADPFVFHWINILLHSLNSVLLFVFLSRFLKLIEVSHFETIAFFTSLIWLVHPVHTEAIAYISGTADPLSVAFSLSSLIFCLRQTRLSLVFAVVFSGLALLSKEGAVTLSGIVFALFLCLHLKSESQFALAFKRAALYTLPFLMLAGFYTTLRGSVLNLDDSFKFYTEANVYTQSIWYRTLTAMAAVSDYLQLLLWPTGLHIDREYKVYTDFLEPKVVFGFALTLFSFILTAWSLRSRKHVLLFGLLWFWSTHSLHTGIFLPLNSLFLEHWLYLPSIGLILLLAYSAFQIQRRFHILIMVGFLGVAFAFGLKTMEQNRVWKDPITLYTHILNFSPNVARVHNNLAMALSDKGDLKQAELHYLKSISIRDDYPQVRHNLGLIYLRQGNLEKALAEFTRAVSMQESFYHSYVYLAQCHERLGEKEKALKALELFEKHRPKF